MSVINQVLLDLEKRRASPAERGTVPNHVRALPDSGRSTHWVWIAGAAAAAAATAAAAWMVMGGPGTARVGQPAPRTGAEVAIERVVTASAGVELSPQSAREPVAAFQLSFELSNPPADPPAPLPTSRVLAKPEADSAAGADQPGPKAAARLSQSRPDPAVVAAVKSAPKAALDAKPEIKKQVREPSSRERAEDEYRRATAVLHQGRHAEAQEGFEAALNLNPAFHAARQALVGLMVGARRLGDAERLLQEGIAIAPAQIGFAMALARLQVDRGEAVEATATLRKGLEYAQGSPDYGAFLAALLQRQGRHEEAIEQFQAALRARPGAGVWWLGLGISLQAVNRGAEAQDAYRRARAANNLSPELSAFAEQRIKQLQ